MRLLIFLMVFLYSLVFLPSKIYALEEIGQSKLHPASPLYFLKTVRENLEIKFAQTFRTKILRRLEFGTRRLREVKSLIKISNFELIIPTLENYWFQVSSLPEKDIKDEQLSKMISNNLSTHLETLEQIYPKIEDARAKMAVRTAVNRLVGRADISNSTRVHGCNFLSFEATTSAELNEVERVILKERAEKCFKILQEIY